MPPHVCLQSISHDYLSQCILTTSIILAHRTDFRFSADQLGLRERFRRSSLPPHHPANLMSKPRSCYSQDSSAGPPATLSWATCHPPLCFQGWAMTHGSCCDPHLPSPATQGPPGFVQKKILRYQRRGLHGCFYSLRRSLCQIHIGYLCNILVSKRHATFGRHNSCVKPLPFPRLAPPFLHRKQAAADAHQRCYGTRSPWTREMKTHYKIETSAPPTKRAPTLMQVMSARDYTDVEKVNPLTEMDPATRC